MLKLKNIKDLKSVPTPFWYYDMDLFRRTIDEAVRLSAETGVLIHYSIKANAEPRLVDYIAAAGLGADCVSGNEVLYALDHGFPAEKIVFAGVGKTDKELTDALKAGIGSFNSESIEELQTLERLGAEMGLKANVSVRINPDVDAHTHRFITTGLEMDKFGIPKKDMDTVIALIKDSKYLNFKGLHFHIGSQITDVENVFTNECISANGIVAYFESQGLRVDNIDLGGGLGVDYYNPDSHAIPEFGLWFQTLTENLRHRPDQQIHVEPGRALVAQCASLVSRVIFVKEGERKSFVILDAGMNDLLRPALYGAYHKIENLTWSSDELRLYDVVGPVCETTDLFAEDRTLPLTRRGDLVALRSAGAYGSVMSSTYNMRAPARSVFSDDPAE
ncbi:MAG: diaminopimelate decarboxylase [Bacteroidales bacterium]|nr:diaminopimelate decarboxylase [Bacteroidales bacterium]